MKNKKNTQPKRINRREFLRLAALTGTILTVPQFAVACNSPDRRRRNATDHDAAHWRDYPIAAAARIAITAPNPHNTQAWKFSFDSPTMLTLYVDKNRILPETDPPARQIHIGQGTFLELLRLSAASLGYATEITLFPQGVYRYADIGKKPVASVKLKPDTTIRADALFAHWQSRVTNRSAYEGPAISADEFSKLSELAAPQTCTLRFLSQGPQLSKISNLLYEAMKIETYDAQCADENYRWFRLSDHEIAEKADGTSLRGNAISGIKLWLARSFYISSDKASFLSKDNNEAYLKAFREGVQSTQGMVIFTTNNNTQTEWVKTGYDYLRFHLAATALGLSMHPLSQILQEYPAMDKLRTELENVMQVSAPAKMQMIVRLGRSDYRYFAPRRKISDLLI